MREREDEDGASVTEMGDPGGRGRGETEQCGSTQVEVFRGDEQGRGKGSPRGSQEGDLAGGGEGCGPAGSAPPPAPWVVLPPSLQAWSLRTQRPRVPCRAP